MRYTRLGRRLAVVGAALAVVFVVTATSVSASSGTQGNTQTGRPLVTFDGGIGVEPVSAGVGAGPTATTVNRNIVRGVQPAGQPWVIAELNAKVKADGRITVRGKGLVFAGGNTVGTALVINSMGVADATLSVFATLICENVAPFVELDTKAVPLAANGDFTIDDRLSLPASCPAPVLLIRNAGNQSWFAAGIRKFTND